MFRRFLDERKIHLGATKKNARTQQITWAIISLLAHDRITFFLARLTFAAMFSFPKFLCYPSKKFSFVFLLHKTNENCTQQTRIQTKTKTQFLSRKNGFFLCLMESIRFRKEENRAVLLLAVPVNISY